MPYDTMTARRTSHTPEVLSEFERHTDAQRLVDQLSDGGSPVDSVRIVGHDLHTVEQVTGRLTDGRASLLGAAPGAWVGLLVGMLLALPTVGPVSPLLFLGSLTIGAFCGAVLGFVGHWARRGRRDSTSAKG